MKLAYNQMMPNTYSTIKDLNDRLDSSLIKYKGRPYRCRVKIDAEGHPVLYLYRLDNIRSGRHDVQVKPSDPDLDISILESMYMNLTYKTEEYEHPPRACWITRGAAKHYKSGTYSGYSRCNTIDGKISSEYSCDTIFWTKEFEAAILGEYPSLASQIERMEGMKREEFEIAVDQRVALKRESIGLIKVYIDTRIVGWIDPDNGRTKITNDDRRWAIVRLLEPLGFKV